LYVYKYVKNHFYFLKVIPQYKNTMGKR
jgi:hypothetical protein